MSQRRGYPPAGPTPAVIQICNGAKMTSKTYHYNIIWRLLSYLWGCAVIAMATAIFLSIPGLIKYPSLCGEIFYSGFALFLFLGGLTYLVTPTFSALILEENGFTYRTASLTVRARWVECRFNNRLARFIGNNRFLTPLNYEVKYSRLGNLLRTAGEREKFDGPVVLWYFGCITHHPLMRTIREHAPYLFGYLLSDQEFFNTLQAMDCLVSGYLNREIPYWIFDMQYRLFYERYIQQGQDTVRDFFNMATRYTERLAYHAAVWNEIVVPHFIDENRQLEQDGGQLAEIKARFGM